MGYLTRTVWVLSLISLFTDAASEMLYPIMPVYLNSIGFSVLFIGWLEGVAEATAGFSKGYFGKWSDRAGRRVPFVQLGYGLSALSKPFMSVSVLPIWIFFVRTLDRFGKGIRTGARDALLSSEATPETKARIFGFHRSMDTMGAVIGPLFALVYLHYHPNQYRNLFLLAFVPGILALGTSWFLIEKPLLTKARADVHGVFSVFGFWKEAPDRYRRLVFGLLLFSLFNSADAFLLLQVKASGCSDAEMIQIYIFYNLVYALAAFPMGIVADRLGVKRIFLAGLVLFSLVYLGMAQASGWKLFALLFFLYGLYAAATEGVAKAWVSSVASQSHMAAAMGTYAGLQSVMALLASGLTGCVWFQFGAAAAMYLSATGAVTALLYLLFIPDGLTKRD
ncbi:MAG: MFS transporter [Chitinophagales bacterium]